MHDNATIAEWLRRILGHEGGYTDDPNDPGNWTGGAEGLGELKGTKWGIAANTYGHLNIAGLTAEDAADIYRADFVLPMGLDRFEDGVAFALLDFAVNSGGKTAIVQLQEALGVPADGIVGPVTSAAIGRLSEASVVMLISAERLDYYASLRHFSQYGRGWVRRMASNLRHAAKDIA